MSLLSESVGPRRALGAEEAAVRKAWVPFAGSAEERDDVRERLEPRRRLLSRAVGHQDKRVEAPASVGTDARALVGSERAERVVGAVVAAAGESAASWSRGAAPSLERPLAVERHGERDLGARNDRLPLRVRSPDRQARTLDAILAAFGRCAGRTAQRGLDFIHGSKPTIHTGITAPVVVTPQIESPVAIASLTSMSSELDGGTDAE